MRRPGIYFIVYQIALHPAMTVMPLFATRPGTKLQAPYPFGIFPFLMSSTVPDTSAIILLKNATSILPFIHIKKIITPGRHAVNCFAVIL